MKLKILKNQKKKMVEIEEIIEYKKQVNSNPILKKYGLRLVNRRNYRIFQVMGILFLLIFASLVGTFLYLGTEGKLSSTYETIINPLFNASVKVENSYEFKPKTENDYEFFNEFKPNYTIEINIPENFCT